MESATGTSKWEPANETSKWEPANGNQQMETIKSQKETSPLAHFVCNSLPHKSFRFCSPMQKHMESATGTSKWEPANGNHQIAKRNFPSCSLRSQFTASQKLPLLFPNARPLKSTAGNHTLKSADGNHIFLPLLIAKAINSLPHFATLRSPMLDL